MLLDLAHPERYDDVLRLPGGTMLRVRFAEPVDAAPLQGHFRALSPRSRYNRLMGPAPELPPVLIERFLKLGEADAYTLLASLNTSGGEQVIGEVRYAFSPETATVEFGLSVADHWHGHGIGSALIDNVACRAAALGALRLVGDTLRDNHAMIALARKAGFSFAPTPGDWKQVRFEKHLAAVPLARRPCASARLAAAVPHQ